MIHTRVAIVLVLAGCGGRVTDDASLRNQAPVPSDGGGLGEVDPGSGGIDGAGGSGGAAAGLAGTGGATSTGGATMTGGATSMGGTAIAGAPSCGLVISDMEDGTGRICTGEHRVGVWYAFNDQSRSETPIAQQWPASTPPGTPITPSDIPGGRGNSRRAMHTYGGDFVGWGAGIGLDFNYDGKVYGSYDASRYTGFTFWARSDDSTQIRVRLSTLTTTYAEYGGACDCEVDQGGCVCEPDHVIVQLDRDWTEYRIYFGDYDHYWRGYPPSLLDRSTLTNLQFFADPEDGMGIFDFWIDDVAFFLPEDPS
ncbi:MAG: hypothetical protein JW751_12935 [Polyangiaceae bacterium]|nr:hypothetical protein [Polyangiaceae bacterium]